MDVGKKLKEFEAWFDALTEVDKMNFSTIINMPSLVEKLPKGKYRDMCVFAMAIKSVKLEDGAEV